MMDGREFLAVAGKLAASPHADEATYRTAVSRAYYGAFHVAREFLVELGFAPIGNANVHAFVRHYLHGSGHPEGCLAATQLSRLQTARNSADYDLTDTAIGARAFAMVCVEQSHRIVAALENCRTAEARETIREGIIAYEQKVRPR